MQSTRRSGITGHLSNSVIYDIKITGKIEDYSCKYHGPFSRRIYERKNFAL